MDQFARISVADIANFKHVEQPRGLPLEPLKALFGMLGLAQGKLVNENTREQAVQGATSCGGCLSQQSSHNSGQDAE